MVGPCDRLARMKAVEILALLMLLTACNAGPRVVVHEEEETTPAPQAAVDANWDYKTEDNTSWACTHSVNNDAELCFRRAQGRLDSSLTLTSLRRTTNMVAHALFFRPSPINFCARSSMQKKSA